MAVSQLTGPGAGSRKYDLLTALGAHALAADRSTQRRVLRLMTLITARYNWRLGELSVGRREIARLWCVDERTVKREIGALKGLGFLSVKRAGARGRVTTYRIEIDAIMAVSEPGWERVGPDFADRMKGMAGEEATKVVPFPASDGDRSEWSRARALLRQADPARFRAWFSGLNRDGVRGQTLVLRAPSTFHATYVGTHLLGDLTRAVHRVEPELTSVVVVAD